MRNRVLGRSLSILVKFPVRLWGISLFCTAVELVVLLAGIFVPIISIPIVVTISTGMSVIYLNGYNGIVPTSAQLFDGFKKGNAQRVIGGSCWKVLWQLIWLCVPVANIVKALQYAFTPYILMQRPDVSPTEALKVSMRETRGYKARIFGAQFLVILIVALIHGILSALGVLPYIGVVAKVVLALFALATNLFLPLLQGLINAGYYDEAQKAKNA
ncbi:MAG: hypothetical protein LIO53_02400 [Oscillospiraceae bacterium]|nr:hypothetical protein [Oscillospiraceae bacterium]